MGPFVFILKDLSCDAGARMAVRRGAATVSVNTISQISLVEPNEKKFLRNCAAGLGKIHHR